MKPFTLRDFVRESNRIEGIPRVRAAEIEAHELFLASPLSVVTLRAFVDRVAGAALREHHGMNVRVGPHTPPPGGPGIVQELSLLLHNIDAGMGAYNAHQWFEHLHPFMDGNGRSGRALWLHMMGGIENAPLGFLHTWYYQSLNAARSVGHQEDAA